MQDLDYELIQKILAGEKAAYAGLVERHKDKALTLAMKMLRNRQDAEEALQDAFVRAFNALPRFERKSSFSTWFYRIVYNVCATALGRRDEQRAISIDDGETEGTGMELASVEATPDVALESSEFNSVVLEEIGKLPEAYGPTFTLFFVQDMSYDEIVEVTGLPLGTVKARLFRARTMLRNALVQRLGNLEQSKTGEADHHETTRVRRNGTEPY